MSSDPWRYRCPEGHTNVRGRVSTMINDTGTYYHCRSCGKDYDRLVDAKTGKKV